VAYSEFVFTDVHWPDFTSNDLAAAVATYQHRQRRYGGLKTSK
jgi:undecaprenyl diphosphate synthase